MACWGCLRLLERLGDHVLTIPDEATVRARGLHLLEWPGRLADR